MEVTKKRMNNKDKRKITITLGGVGGIGGVALFVGGALVTAAFASAFVLKRRWRRSAEVRPPRGGIEEVKEGHEIHISSDTSLRGEQSEKETERDDSHMLVSTHSPMQHAMPGTENSDEVPSEKEETLVSMTLRKPENDVIPSDSLFIKEGSRSSKKLSLSPENPEIFQSVVDEDFASQGPKDETIDDSKQVSVDGKILDTKEKDDAVEVNEENIKILYCDDKEVNAEEENPAVGPGLDVEKIEPQKNENVEKAELGEFIGDNIEIDAKRRDEITEKKEDIGYIDGSLAETESLIEDKHENVTNDVIMEKSVVCESKRKEAGDSDPVSKQEDIEDVVNDTVSKLENDHGHGEEDDERDYHHSYETIKTADGDHMETSEYVDETESSLEIESEEISDGSADSSLESNSDAVPPTEYLKEPWIEPRINDREVEGKMQEDKADKESDLKHGQSIKSTPILSATPDSSTKRRMLVVMLLMLSSVSGSCFFGLSLAKLCLIALLTILLSELNVC